MASKAVACWPSKAPTRKLGGQEGSAGVDRLVCSIAPYHALPYASLEGGASPGKGTTAVVETATGAFARVELQWKDVNYTVREGKKGEIVKKVRAHGLRVGTPAGGRAAPRW